MKEKITKPYIQNHFLYFKWVYVSILIFAVMGWSLIFAVTRPEIPEDKRIDVYFCGKLFSLPEELQTEAEAAFPDMEEIGLYDIDVDDYDGYQKFSVMLAAHEGDIFVISKSYLSYFVSEWLAAPLETYVDNGTLVTLTDYTKTTKNRVPDPYNPQDTDTSAHIYAVDCSQLYGLMNECYYDNRDAVMIVTTFSGNEENAVKMLQWLYDRYYVEGTPEYVEKYDQLLKQLIESGSLSTGTGAGSLMSTGVGF